MPLVKRRDTFYHTCDNHYRFAEHHGSGSFLKKQFDPDVSGLISIDYQESTSRQQFRCF